MKVIEILDETCYNIIGYETRACATWSSSNLCGQTNKYSIIILSIGKTTPESLTQFTTHYLLIHQIRRRPLKMGEPYDSDDRNGAVTVEEEDGVSYSSKGVRSEDQTVYEPLRRLIAEIFFPDEFKGTSLFHRVKLSVAENGPAVGQACRNVGRDVLRWTRRGSPLRALLVISVSIPHDTKLRLSMLFSHIVNGLYTLNVGNLEFIAQIIPSLLFVHLCLKVPVDLHWFFS